MCGKQVVVASRQLHKMSLRVESTREQTAVMIVVPIFLLLLFGLDGAMARIDLSETLRGGHCVEAYVLIPKTIIRTNDSLNAGAK